MLLPLSVVTAEAASLESFHSLRILCSTCTSARISAVYGTIPYQSLIFISSTVAAARSSMFLFLALQSPAYSCTHFGDTAQYDIIIQWCYRYTLVLSHIFCNEQRFAFLM